MGMREPRYCAESAADEPPSRRKASNALVIAAGRRDMRVLLQHRLLSA